jgi:hypothetical protein
VAWVALQQSSWGGSVLRFSLSAIRMLGVLKQSKQPVPDFVNPAYGLTVETLLVNLNSNKVVRKKGTID